LDIARAVAGTEARADDGHEFELYPRLAKEEKPAMLERVAHEEIFISAPSVQKRRRMQFFTLVGVSIVGLLWLLVSALSAGGFGLVDAVLVLLFAVTLPWFTIGFWNGTIGLLVMRCTRDPVATVTPVAARVTGSEPVTASTAILLCIRNEPPERVIRHVVPLLEGLVVRGVGERYQLYGLSDTDDPAIAAAEAACFAELAQAWKGLLAIHYRRREQNTAYKAGNIRDFCDCFGKKHDFALVLDADSVMTADSVVRLTRIMQADPHLGILQSLVTGLPSTSAFARIFQFGMRLGMRSYTLGSAWWQGDCGPYWGHNAIIRLAPFMAHCQLPMLPGGRLTGGHVLSHDQVEAVLMRRAGFDVRVLPEEGGSFEQNPPTLIEFIRRDLRWCQGNMQYWHFLFYAGLKPISRYQLAFAILMFIGSPAWIGLLVIGTLAVALATMPAEFIKPDVGFVLFVIVLVMWFAPKIATIIDVLSRPELRAGFGGGVRFAVGAITETVFFVLLAPIMWFSHTIFLVRLLAGRSVGWGVQARDDHTVPLSVAFSQLWPHTLLGLSTVAILGLTVPAAIPYALFIAGGPLVSIPLAIISASPAVGRALMWVGLGRLPEETDPPAELRALALPAIVAAVRPESG
jgi:membrane glycosyltransferase